MSIGFEVKGSIKGARKDEKEGCKKTQYPNCIENFRRTRDTFDPTRY